MGGSSWRRLTDSAATLVNRINCQADGRTDGNSFAAAALFVLASAFSLVNVACHASERSEPPQQGATGDVMLPRQELVAQADRMAAAASSEKDENAARSLQLAAGLRERLWRLEGRTADGLEAVDLLESIGKRGRCMSTISGQALRAEVENNPVRLMEELTRLLAVEREPECQQSARKLLAVLGGGRGGGLSGAATVSSATEAPPESMPRVPASLVVPSLPEGLERLTPRVKSVERYGAKDSARIVVALSHPTTFRAGTLRSETGGAAARLYVDMDRAVVDRTETHEVGGLVQRVRLGQRPEGVRLVLELEEAVEQRIFYMPEPFRLIVDVARATTALKYTNRGPRIVERVVIDPGHGGYDPGAIGPRGLREKDVTLDIAHRAAPLIARELGLSTLLTRDTDLFVALDERAARANAFRADLFVSIHCNAAERTGSDGVMTYVLDTSSDAAASRMAALENAASDAAAKELASSFGRAQDEGLLARSLHFADLLQRATVASLGPVYGPIRDQGVKRAGFYVLAGAHMPAVLFEVAFISNPSGEVHLNTADYRQKLADSLVNAVRAYRDGI
jgi:N-acetylmuramoyl-L-alanine amidase